MTNSRKNATKNATRKNAKNATKNATSVNSNVYRFNSVSIVTDKRDDFQKACDKYEYAQTNSDKRLYKYNYNASKSSLNSNERVKKTSVNYSILNEYSKAMQSHADRFTISKKATVYVRNNSYKVEVREKSLADTIADILKIEYTTLTKSFSFKRLTDAQLREILAILSDETSEESEN